MKKIVLTPLLIAILVIPTLSFAGYIFEQEIDMGKQKMKMIFSVQGDYKRIDSYVDNKLITSQISSPSYGEPLLLIHEEKQYMKQRPMQQAEANATAGKGMKDAMQSMKESGMSKEQMEMIEKMMKSQEEGKKTAQAKEEKISPNDFTVKPTSHTKTIGAYKTQHVEIYYKSTLFQDQWVTKDIPKEAMDAMNSFINDKKLFPATPSKTQETMKSLKNKVDSYGYPVLTIAKYDKNTRSLFGYGAPVKEDMPKEVKIEMKKIEKKNISTSEFAPPKDYKEMTMPSVK